MLNLKHFEKVINKAFDLDHSAVIENLSPEELSQKFDISLGESLGSQNQLDAIIEGIFQYSVNTQNPRFLNQLYGGSCKEAWLGELLVSILNTSMATYEIAPLATLMEKEIIKSLNKEIGFKKIEGLIVPGGSYANMMGINCARFYSNSNYKNYGVYNSKKIKVFISEDAHYSSKKAVELLGLGADALVKVKTNSNREMCSQDFEDKVKTCLSNDEIPLCLVSTSGTTVWGAFDQISELNYICRKYNIWHHVDAAWGGLGIFSEEKKLFKGIELVDSITMDFHKAMGSTLTKGIFLTSKPDILRECNSGGGGSYIFHKGDDSPDIGTYSLQCGRKVDSLPIWLQWKLNGSQYFREKLNNLLKLKDQFCELLAASPSKYKLLHHPDYLNICFQVLPNDENKNISEFNRVLRQKLMERGLFMVNFSSNEKNGVFFRLALAHNDVDLDILTELLVELDNIKKLIENN